MTISIRRLGADELGLIGAIDRSEKVDVQYVVVDGRLTEREPLFPEVRNWDPVGNGPFSVAAQVAFCASALAGGAIALGAFDGDRFIGIVVVPPTFEDRLAWLVFLYVSRPERRRGAARALWKEAVDIARASRARAIYVSAVPTGSAVSFYVRQGCRLADPVHPRLFADEPEDIHLVIDLDDLALDDAPLV